MDSRSQCIPVNVEQFVGGFDTVIWLFTQYCQIFSLYQWKSITSPPKTAAFVKEKEKSGRHEQLSTNLENLFWVPKNWHFLFFESLEKALHSTLHSLKKILDVQILATMINWKSFSVHPISLADSLQTIPNWRDDTFAWGQLHSQAFNRTTNALRLKPVIQPFDETKKLLWPLTLGRSQPCCPNKNKVTPKLMAFDFDVFYIRSNAIPHFFRCMTFDYHELNFDITCKTLPKGNQSIAQTTVFRKP